MPHDPTRRQVAYEAARLLYAREECEYYRAKVRAARTVFGGRFSQADLPRNSDIRDQILEFARADRREIHRDRLGTLRPIAFPTDLAANPAPPARSDADRYLSFTLLLEPLEQVKQDRDEHPEGDALDHSLQVFELVRDKRPYDEELLLAALLHDVGKAIDPRDRVSAALEVLEGLVTTRTLWFIEHHSDALAWSDSGLGQRVRKRLRASDDFDELMLLAQCDRAGRQVGFAAPDVQKALHYVRDLGTMCDG
jgi:hypothetical protein